MNFIYLKDGFSYGLNPVFDLIEQKPELIVGCILVTPDAAPWFIESLGDNTAQKLLDLAVNDCYAIRPLDAFILAKEPNSYFQLTVFAAINCCNLNVSGTGGRYGKTLLRLLAKHNIRTHPAEIAYPDYHQAKTWEERRSLIEECFWKGFNCIAYEWLPEIWEITPGHY